MDGLIVYGLIIVIGLIIGYLLAEIFDNEFIKKSKGGKK